MAVKLTIKGEELLQKLQAGEIEKLIFTDMAIGCGSWNNDEFVSNISALKDIKLKQAIATKYAEHKGDKTLIFVSTTFSNKKITDTFYVYEVGLYALYGDIEVLYAYDIVTKDMPAQAVVQDQSVPQYVPVSIDIGISNIDAINLTLTDDLSVVSAEQFRSHIEDYNNPHKVIDIIGNAATATMAESLGYNVLQVSKQGDLGYDANLVTSPGQYLIIFNTDADYDIMRDGHYAYDYGILYLNVELISIKDPDTEEEIEIIMQECLAPFGYWLKSNNSMNRTSGLQNNPSDFTDWIEKSISITAFNPLPINHGGTGEITADNARNALKAAAISHTHKEYQPAGDYANINHKHDLTDSKIEGILPLNKGGTGRVDGISTGFASKDTSLDFRMPTGGGQSSTDIQYFLGTKGGQDMWWFNKNAVKSALGLPAAITDITWGESDGNKWWYIVTDKTGRRTLHYNAVYAITIINNTQQEFDYPLPYNIDTNKANVTVSFLSVSASTMSALLLCSLPNASIVKVRTRSNSAPASDLASFYIKVEGLLI